MNKYDKRDIIVLTAEALIAIAMWVLAIALYAKSQQTIPLHFDICGKPNGWGPRIVLLIQPLLATVMAVVIELQARFSKDCGVNFPGMKIASKQSPLARTLARRLCHMLTIFILLIFISLIMQMGIPALHGLPAWKMPIIYILAAAVITTIFYARRISRLK